MPVRPFIFLIIFAALIIQVSVMPNFFSSGISPNLLVVLLVFFTAEAGFSRAWKWAVLGGLAVDLIFFNLPGTSVFSFLIIAYATEIFAGKFLAGQHIWKVFILAIISFFSLIFDNSLAFIFSKVINYFYATGYREYFSVKNVFWSAFYNFILAIVIYWPFRKVKKSIISSKELKV